MINSVNQTMQPSMMRTDQSLTQEQQNLLSETLAQFEPENLTTEDAKAIIDTLSSAGIPPGRALESAMSELGFDAKNIGDLGNVENKGNRPPPPPVQTSEELTELIDFLAELLEEKLATSGYAQLTDEDRQGIYFQVSQKFELTNNDSIIDTKV